MAVHIEGPLYYETIGRSGPVMAFVHPNPMDQSCWIFQMAQMSTWYRCIALDLPGYGRSPKARDGLTMQEIAQACWAAVDDAYPGERAVPVGCSIGSSMLTWMHNERPQQTAATIMCGTGYNPKKEFIPPRGRHLEAAMRRPRRQESLAGYIQASGDRAPSFAIRQESSDNPIADA